MVNEYLDADTDLYIGEDGRPISRRYIADIFINGWIFHVKDTPKTEMYRKWASDDIIFHAIEQEFIATMHNISRVVEYIAELSRRELSK